MFSYDIDTSWMLLFEEESQKQYYKNILQTLQTDTQNWIQIYPPVWKIFQAFKNTAFDEVKVIILGQDPYHKEWQAHWLSFSVPKNIKIPPSLRNIMKELQTDLNQNISLSWDLTSWSKQWVLLLNSILTVQSGKPWSHAKIWWEVFTDTIIKNLSDKKEHLVFILWWNYAKSKKSLIDTSKHCIITSAHPSPLSAYNGFFGSQPFTKTNTYLLQHNKQPIEWNIF